MNFAVAAQSCLVVYSFLTCVLKSGIEFGAVILEL